MTDQRVPRQRTESSREHDDQRELVHGVKRRLTSLPWLARASGVGLSSVSIGFVALFLFVLETGGEVTFFTRPLTMQVALALPYLVGALTLGTTAGALVAWRYRYWSLPVRVHQTVLALLGFAFSWQLWTLGFLAS